QKRIEGFTVSCNRALSFTTPQAAGFGELITDREFLLFFVRQPSSRGLSLAMTAGLLQHFDQPLDVYRVVIGQLERFVERANSCVVILRACVDIGLRIVQLQHLWLIIKRRAILPGCAREIALRFEDSREYHIPT